jgi:hypothetical protein
MSHWKPNLADPVDRNVALVTGGTAGIGRAVAMRPDSAAYAHSAAERIPLRRAWSNTVEILRQQEWLTPLDANDLARVARVCKPRSWTASNIISSVAMTGTRSFSCATGGSDCRSRRSMAASCASLRWARVMARGNCRAMWNETYGRRYHRGRCRGVDHLTSRSRQADGRTPSDRKGSCAASL